MEPNELPNPENPELFSELKRTAPKKTAAGIPAVVSAVKHIFSEMDLARGTKALLSLNQKKGFDCPGCAWPDPDDERSAVAEYCENGAKAIAEEATTKALWASFFESHSINELATFTDYEIGKSGRIAEPLYLPQGGTHYQSITWDAAFELIANRLNELPSPNDAVFYTSGRTSNEAAFLYQLFVRAFGTNNLPDCSNMCHESSGVALNESVGIGKGSVTLADFEHAEVIIILGQNPGTNHPRMLSALQQAKSKGCTIISVNPLPEAGLLAFNNPQKLKGVLGLQPELTDLFLQVKINGDLALLKAIEMVLWESEKEKPGAVFDLEFIKQNTDGYDGLVQTFSNYTLTELSEICGISETDIRKAAAILQNKNKIIACWAMGLTQHKNAVDTIKEVVNLLLLKGSIGKQGAGTCPVRGHSNVQGDRTMGIYEKPSKAFIDKLNNVFGIQAPYEAGYDVVDCIKAMYEEPGKVFIAMGGNFLSATPDTLYTAKALRNCRLTVHISTKLNRSHLICGTEALILPTLGRSDADVNAIGEHQFVTCENSMGVVQMSKGNLKPVSQLLLSEAAIVCRLAKATLRNKTTINWNQFEGNNDAIRNAIEQTIPGFEDYNTRVRIPGGFYLPNGSREGKFFTGSGKAHFNAAKIVRQQLNEGELMMMTIRTHDQFNTTIYGMDDRYRGIYNERRVVLLNKADMQKLGLEERDIVDLHNHFGGVNRVARKFKVIAYPIPEQCAATYFPETNVLVPIDSVAEKSNTPTSKLVVITIQKSAAS
ncbi:MAG: FdhF/YdeP family oxidoreductase [Bacteroidia bacterium]|jgi:molybdopterin-dependent oxidoreductase alpha subunit|nr:FdhF/YdeP family oxidoreductase [Bacteroidia bacterium]